MARKVFLSFLGTNDYVRCNYLDGKFRDENQKFIQISLLKNLQQEFTQTDIAYFFLTEEARKRNWNTGSYVDSETQDSNKGLQQYLDDLKSTDFKGQTKDVGIANGFTEEEVWEVFQTIYQLIQKGDELYLDVTHAFRYFPLLGFALLNYARALKDITVRAIYYGAFEKLGPAYEVRKMPAGERNAEILNLVAFDSLQQWTAASRLFLQTGNAEGLQKLAFDKIRPLLQEDATRTPPTQALNLATKELALLTKNIAVNRGKWLLEYDVQTKVLAPLKMYEEEGEQLIPAFRPLVEKIREDVLPLVSRRYPVWLASARFCFAKGLYQQCFTQLQEGIKVEALQRAPETLKLNPLSKLHQEIASEAFTIVQEGYSREEWKKTSKENPDISIAIQESEFVRKIQTVYSTLQSLRNDINHSGYTQPTTAEKLIGNLKNLLQKTEEVLENDSKNSNSPLPVYKAPIFLNHSNHPLATWNDDQRNAASEWGTIEDLPFPNIPPQATPEETHKIAEEQFDLIQSRTKDYDITVHIMGELTYTYYLVTKLKSAGIPCIASTTQRTVTLNKDGTKTALFSFVAFRSY